MKIVFAGPSLAGAWDCVRQQYPSMEFRPPARRGDILRAVVEGATAIGLIDGHFGEAASVWHKEILYALSCNVAVCGGASMGALRAAECQVFGMVGVGRIFAAYASGRLLDDEAVALIHGPEELGWMPLSVPRVDYEATMEKITALGLISAAERDKFLLNAGFLHYSQRTYRAMVDGCSFLSPERRQRLLEEIALHKQDVKREDAQAVLAWIADHQSVSRDPDWTFSHTTHWQRLRREIVPAYGNAHDQE